MPLPCSVSVLPNRVEFLGRHWLRSHTGIIVDTAQYVGEICALKNCSAFISVGDNFYDSGVDFTTGGILRFEEAWVNMYTQGVFEYAPWYQCIGNHDVVKSDAGVYFETTIAPLYDDRWYFVCYTNYGALSEGNELDCFLC